SSNNSSISSSLSSNSFVIFSLLLRSLTKYCAYFFADLFSYGACFVLFNCSRNSSVTLNESGGSQSDSSSTAFPSSNGEINNEHAQAVSANTSFNLAINYNPFFTVCSLQYCPR